MFAVKNKGTRAAERFSAELFFDPELFEQVILQDAEGKTLRTSRANITRHGLGVIVDITLIVMAGLIAFGIPSEKDT